MTSDLELCGGSLLLHEDDDGNIGGLQITRISGGADYVGDFNDGGFPRTLHLRRLDNEDGPEMKYVAEPAATAVWNEAVDRCADEIEALRENTQQLKLHMGEMEEQELRTLKAGMGLFAFLLRSLKRSDKENGDG
jgi:hypothetical protein